MKSLNELFYDVILLNELSGNIKAALRFSDPDGPSGRSGWSFGLCQFDTKHNDSALACLSECGYTHDEIDDIVKQRATTPAKLKAGVVARYDEAQLSRCIYSAMNVVTSKGIIVTDTGAILALADYVNQYGSLGGGYGMTTAMALQAGSVVAYQNIWGMRDGFGFYGNTYPFKAVSPFYTYEGVVVSYIPTYADNTAALAGGLVAGQTYRTSSGTQMVAY